MLSQKYDLYYFKVDGILDEYTRRGAQNGYPVCKKIVAMDAEQTWMRDPLLQCREELDFYAEVFEYVSADLKRVAAQRSVITEGAAYVPKLMRWAGVLGSRYIAITPAGEFQIFHYSKREFVPYILEGCRSKDQAFRNWMVRDILFAKEVQKQCDQENYASIINDGSMKIEELAGRVAAHFGFRNE